LNGITLEEVLGSSDGSIDQSFTVANVPFLAGPELWVLEPDAPTPAQRKIIEQEEGAESIQPDEDGNGTWVRWHQTENFFDSEPGVRHYTCDPIKGEIAFGDGRKGWVPTAGWRGRSACRRATAASRCSWCPRPSRRTATPAWSPRATWSTASPRSSTSGD